jgi:hypothetical protein
MPRRVRRRERLTHREAAPRACAGAGDVAQARQPEPRPASNCTHLQSFVHVTRSSRGSIYYEIYFLIFDFETKTPELKNCAKKQAQFHT